MSDIHRNSRNQSGDINDVWLNGVDWCLITTAVGAAAADLRLTSSYYFLGKWQLVSEQVTRSQAFPLAGKLERIELQNLCHDDNSRVTLSNGIFFAQFTHTQAKTFEGHHNETLVIWYETRKQ